MIDREKVIEQCKTAIDTGNSVQNYHFYYSVLALLKEQEPAWISVKDELPKSMVNKVIVYLEHEDYVGYIGFGHYEKFRGEELWYDLENNAQFSKRGYTVTYWMPLPEPPKEGR